MSAPLATPRRGLRRQFGFSIGCVPLRLQTTDEQLYGEAAERYSAFRDSRAQGISIALNEAEAREKVTEEFGYEFEGATLRASADEIRFDGVRNQYALDSLLRVFLSWELLNRGGFLLHAATVMRNGRAFVFTGRSGAGKSTVASLAPEGSVLTDEISLLRREEGQWRAYGTPFWGEFRAAGANASAPVAGLFRLLQSPENKIESVRPMTLLRALLPNVLFFSPDAEDNRRLLAILSQAVTEIPGFHLSFQKSATFWEVLPA